MVLRWLLVDIFRQILVVIAEYKALRDGILAIKNNDFLNLEFEGDSKIAIDFCNKRISIMCYIRLLMEDIWKLS